jgi:hypothetical protein
MLCILHARFFKGHEFSTSRNVNGRNPQHSSVFSRRCLRIVLTLLSISASPAPCGWVATPSSCLMSRDRDRRVAYRELIEVANVEQRAPPSGDA